MKYIKLHGGEVARFVRNERWGIAQLQRRDAAGFWEWDGWTILLQEYAAYAALEDDQGGQA